MREHGLSPITLPHVQGSVEQMSRERKTNDKNIQGGVSILYPGLVILSFAVSANQTMLMLVRFEPERGMFNLAQK